MSLPSIYGDGEDMDALWSLTDPHGYPRSLGESFAAWERQSIEDGRYLEQQAEYDQEVTPAPPLVERWLRLTEEQRRQILPRLLDLMDDLDHQ